jgi:DNA-binding MarR family transcriptional regulator
VTERDLVRGECSGGIGWCGLTFDNRTVYNVNVQQLASENIVEHSPADCAELLLAITPVVMRRIRAEMRLRTLPGLSIPQFRALDYLSHHPQVSLNDVAEHLGLTAPTASKLVQKLVCQKVVARRVAADRRRVSLSLTQAGTAALSMARSETRQQLAESLKSLSGGELAATIVAFRALERAFSQGGNDVNVS